MRLAMSQLLNGLLMSSAAFFACRGRLCSDGQVSSCEGCEYSERVLLYGSCEVQRGVESCDCRSLRQTLLKEAGEAFPEDTAAYLAATGQAATPAAAPDSQLEGAAAVTTEAPAAATVQP